MARFSFYSPDTISEALSILDAEGPKARLIAGGTNLVPNLRDSRDEDLSIVNLGRINDLNYIKEADGGLSIGSLTTISTLLKSQSVREKAPILMEMGRRFAGPLVRNRATLGGNLADASPAADCAPPLLALAARVSLLSKNGERAMRLDEFFLGYRRTAIQPGEILSAVSIPSCPTPAKFAYLKLGRRTAMAISVASAALVLQVEDGKCVAARAAMGAVAPTPLRLQRIEGMLANQKPGPGLAEACGKAVVREISPIDDIRASADYRRAVASALMERAVKAALDQKGE